jgi:hypothetical protein
MKKIMLAIGGFLLTLALVILGRDGRTVKKLEKRRDQELATGSKDALFRAEKLREQAEKRKADADTAAAKTIEKLETLREKDHDMDDLLSAWQSERVRQQQD